jgi:hypothetical protein
VRSRLLSQEKRDYAAIKQSVEWSLFRDCVQGLAEISLVELDSAAKRRAFWINAYNALVTEAVVSKGLKKSVMEVRDFFGTSRYRVGPYTVSLEEIEHGILRGNRSPGPGRKPVFRRDDPRVDLSITETDPRLLFALNCGARSCPPIRSYDAERLGEQLDLAAQAFISGPDVQVDRQNAILRVSEVFRWYAEDFGSEKACVLQFIARYLPPGPDRIYLEQAKDRVSVRYLPYDWALPGVVK